MLELDLGTVEPSLAGPKRPQDRLSLSAVKGSFEKTLEAQRQYLGDGGGAGGGGGGTAVAEAGVQLQIKGETATLTHGSVVIAAITSCTNTSNPSVMLAAGPRRQEGQRELGLKVVKPTVKTSLAPGSKVVTDYLRRRPACSTSSRPWASTSSATAARPASGTRAPCPSRSPGGIEEGDLLVVARCSRATATSRAACTRRCAPTTWPLRRSSWPTRSPVRVDFDPDDRAARHGFRRPRTSSWPTFGRPRPRSKRGASASAVTRAVQGSATPTSSRATNLARARRAQWATPTRGTRLDLCEVAALLRRTCRARRPR